jgi:Fe-S-cluster-containing hydrogenase component 2
MSSTNVAKGVAWVDKRLVGDELAEPDEIKLNGVTQGQLNIMPGICKKVTPGTADSAIYNTGDDELSIAQKMEYQGVRWLEANKKPGSRVNGAALFADMLEADQPMQNRCGTCEKCVMSCPTGALASSKGDSIFDANHCLSYLTIENRGPIPDEAARKMDTNIYGCDRCQEVCPWNRFASPNNIPELQIKGELLEMTKTKWDHLTEDDFKRIFKNSAVKRAKYAGLMRNIHAVEENDKQQKS